MTRGPVRLCRYRSAGLNSRIPVILVADIKLPLAPLGLLHALSQLKTVSEVLGPNGITSCPAGQGAVDVLILRTPKELRVTEVEIQRDDCRFVVANHVAYFGSVSLWNQLDAIKAVA